MGCTLIQEDGYYILKASESIHFDTAKEFSSCLKEAADKKVSKLLLDLSQVDIIYSSGLTDIVGCYTKLKASGGNLIIVSPSDNIKKMLNLLGLNKLITITETIEEAKKA
ncbi:MAG: STAS domain-containing protein [Candidatus Rifleibacteriota bacterium]